MTLAVLGTSRRPSPRGGREKGRKAVRKSQERSTIINYAENRAFLLLNTMNIFVVFPFFLQAFPCRLSVNLHNYACNVVHHGRQLFPPTSSELAHCIRSF